MAVEVNGVPGLVSLDVFTAEVPLKEGNNTITAVAQDASGNVGTASIQVTLDTAPPVVTIDSPPDGFVTNRSFITVTGMINDIVVGTVNGDQAQVTVNGNAAQVANRSFLAADVPLSPGLNIITANGVDRAGNSSSTSIMVRLEVSTEPRIQLISGNNQTGPIGSLLPAPLIVELQDGSGNPVPGKTVIFKVIENNGALANGSNTGRSLAISTDAQGQAQTQWTLGTRAGAGNNLAEATAIGFAGTAIFTATALPAAPAKINMDAGNNQTGVGGQPLPLPFVAVVTDAGHNRLANVPVTFTVLQGGGSFNGQATLTVNTDSDGRALAVLTLGFQEGIDNNVVEANFPGNPGFPASFVASGKPSGDPAATKISGVVLDNTNNPIPGVTMLIEGTTLTAQTDPEGQFVIQSAPVGHVKLIADGSTALRPGTWPTLEYELVTIAGQDNTIGMPIYLLPLDISNGLFVDATTGGTLTLPQVPGFSLTIEPGSATFPDGSRSGVVSVTVVHVDKIPMTPNFGQQPRFIITIQPAGVHFDPPAAVTFPNLDSLAPGEVTELYSFDHDLGQFVAIGTGTVSEDGTVIRSDPGVGIIKGGWHCGGNPQQPGSAGSLKVEFEEFDEDNPMVFGKNQTLPLTAKGKPPLDAKYIKWESDDPSIADFVTRPECADQPSCTAQLMGKKSGTTLVRVTFFCTTTGEEVTTSAKVTVGFDINVTTFIPFKFAEPGIVQQISPGEFTAIVGLGDDRGFSATSTRFRTRHTITVVAGKDPAVIGTPQRTANPSTIVVINFITKEILPITPEVLENSNAGMSASATKLGKNGVKIDLKGTATTKAFERLGLSGLLAIDWCYTVTITSPPGVTPTYTISGGNDNYPAYEVYINNQEIHMSPPDRNWLPDLAKGCTETASGSGPINQ